MERPRIVSEAEAIAIEQMGGIAPISDEIVEQLNFNSVKPETASKKPKQVIVYTNRGRQKSQSGRK